MSIKFKGTPEQIALAKAISSSNLQVAQAAKEIFAGFAQETIQKLILQAGVANMIYSDSPFDEDDVPTYPVDLFADAGKGYLTTWSQTYAGGMPTSRTWGTKEMYFDTYDIQGAFALDKKYLRKARLDVLAKHIERMGQEILYKQELNAFVVLLTALVQARQSSGADHIITSAGESNFVLADLSSLITLSKRINAAWTGGTPTTSSARGLTDLLVSPEIMEQVRAFAFNPLNTKAPGGGAVSGSDTGIPLDDITRREIFTNVGMSEIYGINLVELYELGTSRTYNTLFDQLVGSATVAHGGTTFVDADDEILIGLDLTRNAFVRPVARNAETGGTFTMLPDDQFPARANTVGWYGGLQEGRICVDARAVMGLVV